MNNKIYLAGSCSKDKRKFMEKIADFLRYNDFEVYCPFELKIPDAWSYSQEEWARKVFEKDKEAIKQGLQVNGKEKLNELMESFE